MKWLWAAYRRGALGDLGVLMGAGLDVEGFGEALAEFLERDIHVWVCEAETRRGRVPVGLILARPFIHDMLIVGSMTWFPWASKRNILECAVEFIDGLRRHVHMIFHVEQSDKRFAEAIARHGIARRVGTLYDISDTPLSVWQSRKP